MYCVLQVKALWPKTTDPFIHIIVRGYTSRNFQYRTLSNNKDNIVENLLLKMDQNVSKHNIIVHDTMCICHIMQCTCEFCLEI